jgi:hypothetical protein
MSAMVIAVVAAPHDALLDRHPMPLDGERVTRICPSRLGVNSNLRSARRVLIGAAFQRRRTSRPGLMSPDSAGAQTVPARVAPVARPVSAGRLGGDQRRHRQAPSADRMPAMRDSSERDLGERVTDVGEVPVIGWLARSCSMMSGRRR